MNGQLEKSIVLITSASDNSMKGNVIGTGFAFYQEENYTYLLTCAHVVEDVGGEENVLVNNISAEVVAIGDTQGFDLAVLRVQELLSVLPLRLKILPEEQEISLKISIPGYFLWGENKVRRRKTIKGIMMVEVGEEKAFHIIKNVGEEVAIGKLKIETGKLQKGYSGAPVVDLETGFVVGITTHMEGTNEEEGKEGMAISIEALKKIWPEMPPDVFNSYPEKFDVITVNMKGEEINSHSYKAAFTEDLGNGVMLEMVAIPGGTFMMGSPENEAERSDSESPQHEVTLQPFYMSKYPITQNQYQAIMGKNPSRFKGGNRPVECVSWYDATEFCQKLSQKTGKNYRLPSESQWEYACRAGTTTPFYFGETITSELANYDGNYIYGKAPNGKYREKTTDVGSFPPNAFGLYDMHGNVWEWCADDWHQNYEGAPTDGSAWLENDGKEDYPVLRGGSWINNPFDCRSAIRVYNNRRGLLYIYFGFRVVCDGGRTT
ncbi:MAG: SUMF1/EgtB/PvdO family nonheme iron enzyme [Okeania sp. SIO3B5]|nr:SUMF1/EgtB/PvdO family nonheme iron enzyme [Okeania sp. SIO3B5]